MDSPPTTGSFISPFEHYCFYIHGYFLDVMLLFDNFALVYTPENWKCL